MAEMAIESLGKNDLTVLVCGPGRSIDYRRIAAHDKVKKVAIADLMKFYDDAEWVDLNAPIKERFDIVICCEVIEHFTDPPSDFKKTLGYVNGDGMLVCSTNIYDGGNLEKQSYLFIRGHTSYYTPKALAHIADENGVYVDSGCPRLPRRPRADLEALRDLRPFAAVAAKSRRLLRLPPVRAVGGKPEARYLNRSRWDFRRPVIIVPWGPGPCPAWPARQGPGPQPAADLGEPRRTRVILGSSRSWRIRE